MGGARGAAARGAPARVAEGAQAGGGTRGEGAASLVLPVALGRSRAGFGNKGSGLLEHVAVRRGCGRRGVDRGALEEGPLVQRLSRARRSPLAIGAGRDADMDRGPRLAAAFGRAPAGGRDRGG